VRGEIMIFMTISGPLDVLNFPSADTFPPGHPDSTNYR
jgi:hypothetical protein